MSIAGQPFIELPVAAPRTAGEVGDAPPAPQPRTPSDGARTFWHAYWLAAALCVTKLVQLGPPVGGADAGNWERARDVVVVTAQDTLFALVLGLAGYATLRAARGRPRARRWGWAVWRGLCAACVLYAIGTIPLFGYLHSPVTYQLLYLAGDLRSMRSSLGAFVTPALVAAVVVGPPAYLLVSSTSARLVGLPRRRWAAPALALVALAVAGQQVAAAHGGDRWRYLPDHKLKENPHWALISSCLTATTEASVRLADQFPAENLHDFDTVAERAARGVAAPRALPWDVPPSARPRNVILVVLESTGAQHLDLYGSPYATTPNLQREAAAHGLVFDHVYSHVGLTASSLVPLTISAYPGIGWQQNTQERPDLPGTSLAQVLKPRGYRTAFMSAADLDFCGQAEFLSYRGFDRVIDNRGMGDPLNSWGATDRAVVDRAFLWLDERPGDPFFAVVWTNQAHHPYQLRPGAEEEPLVGGPGGPKIPFEHRDLNRYLNTIKESDRQLARLFDGLRRRGIADDTLVVVTADHGEGFGWPHDCMGHGHLVWQESVHVPCVLWNPRLFSGGRTGRSQTVGGHVDLNPTIAHLLGVGPAGTWQGHSLLDPGRPARAYFYAASHDYLLGVREGPFKYIYNATNGYSELYDLAADPHEQRNVAASDPERCARLRGHVAAWVKSEERRKTTAGAR